MGFTEVDKKLNTSLKEYAASYGDAPKDDHPWACVDAFKHLASMDEAEGSSYAELYEKLCKCRHEDQEAFVQAFIETRMKPLMEMLLSLSAYEVLDPANYPEIFANPVVKDSHRERAFMELVERQEHGEYAWVHEQARFIHKTAGAAFGHIEEAIRLLVEADEQAAEIH